MTSAALLGALARAAPLCLCLPLPGLLARVALALVLALVASSLPGVATVELAQLPAELGRGLAIGLLVGAPLLAARWAGRVLGNVASPRAPTLELAAGTLGWVIFCAAGGLLALVEGYARSYARWPVAAALGPVDPLALARVGSGFFDLAAHLALPALLALALVELACAFLARLELAMTFDVGAPVLARGLRPLVAGLLLAASLGAFVAGIGAAVRMLR